MGTIASQITSLTRVYSIVFSDADQRKHQSSASLAFVRGIHRGPVNSPQKWPVARKMFPFDDVIMLNSLRVIMAWPKFSYPVETYFARKKYWYWFCRHTLQWAYIDTDSVGKHYNGPILTLILLAYITIGLYWHWFCRHTLQRAYIDTDSVAYITMGLYWHWFCRHTLQWVYIDTDSVGIHYNVPILTLIL